MLRLAAGGMLQRWKEIYQPVDNKCKGNVHLHDTSAFTLEATHGVFFALFTLIFASFVVFAVEVAAQKLLPLILQRSRLFQDFLSN